MRSPTESLRPPWSRRFTARDRRLCEGKDQDRIIVLKFLDYGRGDVVVFHVPRGAEEACGAGGVFVKRIVGVPGDVWQERHGFVYINGKKLDEPYIKKDRRDSNSWPRRKVPKDNYFLMGDNREASCDSVSGARFRATASSARSSRSTGRWSASTSSDPCYHSPPAYGPLLYEQDHRGT